ncbi:MAG: AAA family ATPase [Geminicoccaceae bacterium]
MDIASWLAGLGLGRYAPAFRGNDVDAEVLRRLTGDDLRELGVASVGHRRKLLQAIAALPADTPAERRRLTVMFVDLVGSTELAREQDPEDTGRLLRRYHDAVAAEIARVGGHLAKLMGDGVLAYFGWPRAHEDDAERAVRAGLAIAAAVGRLHGSGGPPLRVRVGIATGPVIVGERLGQGVAQEETVVGDAPTLAARLQAAARPGQVLVAAATRTLLGSLFDLEAVGRLDLKGFEAPVQAWAVRGIARSTGRFEALRGSDPAPLVGRERELARLRRYWAAACRGKGRAVLVIGEGGIGKSRLISSLRHEAEKKPHVEICWQASPFQSESPLWPVLRELAPTRSLTALEQRLALSGVDRDALMPLLAEALGLRAGRGQRRPELAADARRARLMGLLAEHVTGLARERPLLLVLEDAQWADASTLELVDLLLPRLEASQALLLMTARPDGLPALAEARRIGRLELAGLDAGAVAAILARLAGGEPDSATVASVMARTGGVPLFVEELARVLAAPGSDESVPATLHDTLMARLDALGEDRELAQLAACVGREVDPALLAAASGLPPSALRPALDRLVRAGLLERRGRGGRARHVFRHALVRDAAYESLLRSRRRAIHARLLAAIESGLAPDAADQAGHHAAAAERWDRALHHFGAAGVAALQRAAQAEGMALVTRALDAGFRLSGDVTAELAMVELRRARALAWLAAGDVARTMVELREADARASRLSMPRLIGQLRVQRAQVEVTFGGHPRRAERYAREALRLAERIGDEELAAAARAVLGLALLAAGEPQRAIAELEAQAAACADGFRLPLPGGGATVAVQLLAAYGEALAMAGRLDEAMAHALAAPKLAQRTANPWDREVAGYHLARIALAGAEPAAALPLAEANLAFAERHGLPAVAARNWALLAAGLHAAGSGSEAHRCALEAAEACAAMRLEGPRTEALLVAARTAEGALRRRIAGDALELARQHGYRGLERDAEALLAG